MSPAGIPALDGAHLPASSVTASQPRQRVLQREAAPRPPRAGRCPREPVTRRPALERGHGDVPGTAASPGACGAAARVPTVSAALCSERRPARPSARGPPGARRLALRVNMFHFLPRCQETVTFPAKVGTAYSIGKRRAQSTCRARQWAFGDLRRVTATRGFARRTPADPPPPAALLDRPPSYAPRLWVDPGPESPFGPRGRWPCQHGVFTGGTSEFGSKAEGHDRPVRTVCPSQGGGGLSAPVTCCPRPRHSQQSVKQQL